ncbi:acyl-CoA thioesterase domain-containing protein [Paenarthrobacter sp. YIM B13468]|uniref:acyl-CoA thioesterase domain-containing protein n=1 Tax=Paenarthrobacter sp. YIM B13468 TaxID=3366295 RepID=UPI00366B5BDA
MALSTSGSGQSSPAADTITAASSGSRAPTSGRVERLLRTRLRGAMDGTIPECTGSIVTGPWCLDQDGRATGLSAAALLDQTLATSIRAAAPELSTMVTTELQLNFLVPPPSDGTVLEAWTRSGFVDSRGGVAFGTLRGPDAREYVHAVGWFQAVHSAPTGALDYFHRMGALPLGATSDVTLDKLLGLRSLASKAANGGPADSDGFVKGPELPLIEEFLNRNGTVHGGVITMMAGLAAKAAMPDSDSFDLQSLRLVFLRPATGPITSRARIRHPGRSLRIVDVELFSGHTTPGSPTSHAPGSESREEIGPPTKSRPIAQAQAILRPAH